MNSADTHSDTRLTLVCSLPEPPRNRLPRASWCSKPRHGAAGIREFPDPQLPLTVVAGHRTVADPEFPKGTGPRFNPSKTTKGGAASVIVVSKKRKVWASSQKLVDHLISDKEMLGGVRLTFRDLYREMEKSSDPTAALEAFLGKCADRDGNPCVKQTVGLLQRRKIRISAIRYISKESNFLEDVEAGMLHSPHLAYTEYPDKRRDEWETSILPVLKDIPLPELVTLSGMSKSQLKEYEPDEAAHIQGITKD